MKKTWIMLGIILGMCHGVASAGPSKDRWDDYFFEVIKKDKSLKQKTAKDINGYKPAGYFKTMLNGPMTPAFKFNDTMGEGYIYGLCEAHNCGSNNMDVVFFKKTGHVKTVTYEDCQAAYSPQWTASEKEWYQAVVKNNSATFARCEDSPSP